MPPPSIPINPPEVSTNAPTQNIVPTNQAIAFNTNVFVRPDYIDEEHWNRLMALRQTFLSENQPVEFYTRILDQNGTPIEGATLTIKLTRVDETLFATTNFFHLNMGDELKDVSLELISDANGWISLTNKTGNSVRVESLIKKGYSWTMPQIGSFVYDPDGNRRVGVAGMEDAFDPVKGYVFYMQKIEK
jgi:hypothetical protein